MNHVWQRLTDGWIGHQAFKGQSRASREPLHGCTRSSASRKRRTGAGWSGDRGAEARARLVATVPNRVRTLCLAVATAWTKDA
jgi:hypothetical protein